MATGQKVTIRMVTDAANTLELDSIKTEKFTYSPAFNTSADIPLSSSGYLAPININTGGGPGNSAAGDLAIVCSVKVEPQYSLDQEFIAYDVFLEYGQAVIPAMTTTFATLVADAVTAINLVIADTNATPQGPYAVGGGGYFQHVVNGVTGPTLPYAPTGPTGATI